MSMMSEMIVVLLMVFSNIKYIFYLFIYLPLSEATSHILSGVNNQFVLETRQLEKNETSMTFT